MLYAAVPDPAESPVHAETEPVPVLLKRVLRNPELLRLDLGILLQHAVLTATFLSVPLSLQQAGMATEGDWRLYLGVLLASVILMGPMIRIAGKGRMQPLMLAAIAAMALAQLGLMTHAGLWFAAAALTLFFAAFNFLEAALPALITQLAPGRARGTAMGVYSSAQFLGIFLGGVLGGWCQGHIGASGGYLFGLVMCLVWLIAAWGGVPGAP